jgi:hypothetical protein
MIQGGFTLAEQTVEQLQKQLAEALKKLKKAKKAKKGGDGFKPSFPGQHRGY